MQRFLHRRKLLSSIPFGIRHSSTVSSHKNAGTPKRAVRAPMTRLGDIVIPTPEEVRAKSKVGRIQKASVPFSDFYEPDVSYLNDAANDSLSAKLLRSLNDASGRAAPTEEGISASIKKRRLDRLAREANNVEAHLSNYVPVPQKAGILRSQLDKSSAFMSPERTHADLERRKVWAESRKVTEKYRTPSDSQEQYFGQHRRRRIQPASTAAARWSGEKDTRRKLDRKRRARSGIQTETLSTFDHQVDESIFTNGGHNPEFTGPEALSPTLVDHLPSSGEGVVVTAESGKAIKIPIARVDSFAKGDYTPYLTTQAKDFGIPPDSLGAVKVAARMLASQRQYSLPVRLRILDLVAKATKSLSKQAVKSP